MDYCKTTVTLHTTHVLFINVKTDVVHKMGNGSSGSGNGSCRRPPVPEPHYGALFFPDNSLTSKFLHL